MAKIQDLNVVFAGCAKNCEKFLPKVLENISHYSKIFKKTSKIIVENGSTDKTKDILDQIKNEDNIILFRDEFNQIKQRTIRLSSARNLIIDEIKISEKLKNFDLLILLDLDDRAFFQIENQNLIKAINFLYSSEKIAAVFANQPNQYYDVWALLDDLYCKNDFWSESLKYTLMKINSDEPITFEILKDLKTNFLDKTKIFFHQDDEPYKVHSAFGGFGIYKIKDILKNKKKYVGEQYFPIKFKDGTKKNVHYQKSEHVNFNLGLKELGYELYILPYLINSKPNVSNYKPEAAFQFIINKNEILNL